MKEERKKSKNLRRREHERRGWKSRRSVYLSFMMMNSMGGFNVHIDCLLDCRISSKDLHAVRTSY